MSAGRLFQTRRPATGKARMPIVDSLNGGTTRQLVPAERRDCRPGRSATWTTGPRYSDVISCRTLNVSTAILHTTRSGTRSQCKLTSDRSVEVYKSTERRRSAPTGDTLYSWFWCLLLAWSLQGLRLIELELNYCSNTIRTNAFPFLLTPFYLSFPFIEILPHIS